MVDLKRLQMPQKIHKISKRTQKPIFGNFGKVFNYVEQLGDLIILADVFHAFLTIAAGSVSNRQLDILRVSTSLNNWQILFHNCPEIYPRASVTLAHIGFKLFLYLHKNILQGGPPVI